MRKLFTGGVGPWSGLVGLELLIEAQFGDGLCVCLSGFWVFSLVFQHYALINTILVEFGNLKTRRNGLLQEIILIQKAKENSSKLSKRNTTKNDSRRTGNGRKKEEDGLRITVEPGKRMNIQEVVQGRRETKERKVGKARNVLRWFFVIINKMSSNV